ncbi:hypothetical protein RHS01_02119 [Rhizoctonia solani]|uniref:Fungal-type protein kinase domain-containing protein n=1 Tax=Rhizoctonia solani TaxID=456999 RepID=A0A8H7M9Q4_9AGAM|nr:hypothetical protein RHS01_02119 [Rhizoctonia solani]
MSELCQPRLPDNAPPEPPPVRCIHKRLQTLDHEDESDEINGAVFQYPPLCEELLINQAHLTQTMEFLARSPLLRRDGHWSIDCTSFESADNHSMHQAWADLLDVIMRAAFRSGRFRPGPQPIIPLRGARVLCDHSSGDMDTFPDVAQGHRDTHGRYHWATLEFFAQCKAKPDQLGKALMQIARYSRAMLIHQVYRRFVYSLALCGTEATFVRVGRSGITHSTPIDVKADPEQFIRAAASVFGLDDGQFGVGNPKHRAVLKSIWRYESQPDEGDTLRKLEGSPGICRCHWNEYLNDTKVKDRSLLVPSRYQPMFVDMPEEDRQQMLAAAGSIDCKSGWDCKGKVRYKKAQLKLLRVPEDRVHSLILMEEGTKLRRIKRFRHLMVVLRDALVGESSIVLYQCGAEDRTWSRICVHGYIRPSPSRHQRGNILCQAPGSEDWWGDGMPASTDLDGNDIVEEIPSDAFVSYDFDSIILEDESEIKEANTLQEYIEGRYPSGKSIGRLYDMEFSVSEDMLETDVQNNAEKTVSG